MITGGSISLSYPVLCIFLNKHERPLNDQKMNFFKNPDPDSRSPPRRGGKRGGGPKFIVSRGGAGSGCEKKFENRGGAGSGSEKNSEIGVGRGGDFKKSGKSGRGRGRVIEISKMSITKTTGHFSK